MIPFCCFSVLSILLHSSSVVSVLSVINCIYRTGMSFCRGSANCQMGKLITSVNHLNPLRFSQGWRGVWGLVVTNTYH